MKIADIDLGERPLMLAPMEDVTDVGFRRLCKRYGAAMVYSEFVAAEALIRNIKATTRKLTISDDERPVGIQIYGRTTDAVVEAARIVEAEAHPDVIDLNFGCPVKKGCWSRNVAEYSFDVGDDRGCGQGGEYSCYGQNQIRVG